MVRVGGGWITLASFLDNNDPCRGAVTLLNRHFDVASDYKHAFAGTHWNSVAHARSDCFQSERVRLLLTMQRRNVEMVSYCR